MFTYIVRRLLIGVLTLMVVTCIIYGLIRNMPGTPLTLLQQETRMDFQMSEDTIRRLEAMYHLDKTWYEGYAYWLGDLMQGDLGRSISSRRRVTTIVAERLPRTLLLTGSSLLLTYVLCIPLGLWATASAGTVQERVLITFLYMLFALPAYVAAVYLKLIVAVRLELLPLYGTTGDNFRELDFAAQMWDIIRHSLLPVFCFTYGSLAYYTRFVKSNMMEVVQQDYIRTAKAKGVGPMKLIAVHAFRNTLIPLVTMIGLTLPVLLGGSVILESIFEWNGIGRLFIDSLGKRDYPMIMALTLIFSVMTLAGQLLADILYAVVDPRITYK
ncbi:MAG: ABC transporter permease [Pirellulaceae bacterium]